MKQLKLLLIVSLLSIGVCANGFSLEQKSNEKEKYDSQLILPMYYVNYDRALNWGASVAFVPYQTNAGFAKQFGLDPLFEVGVSKNGMFSGIGGRMAWKENGYTFALYSMLDVAKVWINPNDLDIQENWYIKPRVGFDVTCFNFELNQMRDESFQSDWYLAVKFRITESCAQVVSMIVNG